MYFNTRTYEDLFTIGTRLGELSRLVTIIAEDTEDRACSKSDVVRNMSTLRMVSDELDRLEDVMESLDDFRVKHGNRIADVL